MKRNADQTQAAGYGAWPSFGRSLHALMPVVHLFWQQRRYMLLTGAVLAGATVLLSMALLGLSGWFISASAIAGLSASTALAFDVFMPSAGIRLFALGRTVARYGERLASHDATLSLLAALRSRLFAAWAQPRAARALALRPSRLLFRLTADVDALDSLYLRLLVPLASALLAALAGAAALGLIDPALGLAVLLLLTLGTGLILVPAGALALRPARLRAHAVEALRSRVADLVAGQTDLLMTKRLLAQCQAIARANACLARCDQQLNRLDSQAGMAFGVLGSVVLALTLLLAGKLASNGLISVPLAVLAVLLALTMTEPLAALRRGVLEMGRTVLAARRLQTQLAATDASPAAPVAAQPTPKSAQAKPVLALHQVSARYDGCALDCLSDIDLQLQAGERVALIGNSGAGKSSLLALLSGELSARSGTLHTAEYGWLTQRSELFQDSLRDNLRLANPHASDDLLWQALAGAGLSSTVRSWPQGLATELGEGGLGLSGGQARRLALARLLLRPAPLWLLDEPTEGLDAASAADVLTRLHEQGLGRAWLLATHLRREAELADQLLLLQAGRIVAHWRQGQPGFDQALARLRPD